MSRVVSPPSTQPQATPSKSAMPSHEQIAKRAYEKWVKRGRPNGQHLQDWLEAEAELKKEMMGGMGMAASPGSQPRR